MSRRPAITPSSDPTQPMPAGAGARLDRIEAAISTLRDEERRLGRLGLGPAVTRCREQRRYWEFLRTVFSLEPAPRVRMAREERE